MNAPHTWKAWIPVLVIPMVGLVLSWCAGGTRLVGVCVVAFAMQAAAGFVAVPARDERAYDAVGTLTYLTVVVMALCMAEQWTPRSWVLAVCVTLWALRLGSFLVRRMMREGGDGRFDELKTSPPRFAMVWALQGLWVTLTSLAATWGILSGMGNPDSSWEWAALMVGAGVWMTGMLLELVADLQKESFRARAKNAGRFIRTGLWAWSRHPNYVGEMLLWFGIYLMVLPALEGMSHIVLISPIFVVVLLRFISGVPLLEARADARWGDDPAYQSYKARTPLLIGIPGRGRPT